MNLTLHVLPPSHPCKAVEKALELKGLEYERVELPLTGEHPEVLSGIYGEGRTTVPGMVFGEEPVHGSRPIMDRLDSLVADPPLYPSEAVREADRWGDDELQPLGRSLAWGAIHFRPDALGTFAPGGSLLDPAGTDFAMKFVRASWKYHRISAVRLAEDLAGLPAKLDHADALIAGGVIGGEQANAADLQIASTLRVLLCIGDLRPLIDPRPCGELARRWFPEWHGDVPAGAFPGPWLPQSAT